MPNDTYKIRPAGRHILTIGRDLVQDSHAAILELVKNSYDADSPDVQISLRFDSDKKKSVITITDHGHGMTRDAVINKWMVPSTKDKLKRPRTPAGRTMQGSKGIGRYAASVLGNDFSLTTITSGGEKTTVYLDWEQFEKAEYLQDVEILIETQENTNEKQGTELEITGYGNFFEIWSTQQITKLQSELKKIKSPVDIAINAEDDRNNFTIKLNIKGHLKEKNNICETIEPFPVFDLFDYKIAGTVKKDGEGILFYSQQKIKNASPKKIDENFGETGCGELKFDIRVYDREPDAIQGLVNRAKSLNGDSLGKNEIKNLLNDLNGVGVYRNGFRIRPLGDVGFDWLKLDQKRVQNPSMRIGSNQIIGYVQIQSEENSGLIEKSARDGLKENKAFGRLEEIAGKVIGELEKRRFQYRKKAGLGRQGTKIDKEIERLFSFDRLKRDIQLELTQEGVKDNKVQNFFDLIDKEKKLKATAFENVRRAVAIYQGQATLGKIINVVLHESRISLSHFKNGISILKYWHDEFLKNHSDESAEEILQIAEGFMTNSKRLIELFKRLDPLGATKRSPKKPTLLKDTIKEIFKIFENEMKDSKITYEIKGSENFKYPFWEQDMHSLFTNLINNSIYWIKEKKSDKKKIIVDIETNRNSLLYLDYRDTGPGIKQGLIKDETIFEPGFSTKLTGTGLGLAIAGEAATRNGFELRAVYSEDGAFFQLIPIGDRE